jgi:hypothetical protein
MATHLSNRNIQPQSPYQVPKSNIDPDAVDAPISVGKGRYALLLVLTALICVVIHTIVTIGYGIAYNLEAFFADPTGFTFAGFKAYLRYNYFSYDLYYSVAVYIYAFFTRTTIKEHYRFFNFFHYSLASVILYILIISIMFFNHNTPVLNTLKYNVSRYIPIAISCGVFVYWAWQVVFSRARRKSKITKI